MVLRSSSGGRGGWIFTERWRTLDTCFRQSRGLCVGTAATFVGYIGAFSVFLAGTRRLRCRYTGLCLRRERGRRVPQRQRFLLRFCRGTPSFWSQATALVP